MLKLISKWKKLQEYKIFYDAFPETKNSYWLTDDRVKIISKGDRDRRENSAEIESLMQEVQCVMVDGRALLTTKNRNLFLKNHTTHKYIGTGCIFNPVQLANMPSGETLDSVGNIILYLTDWITECFHSYSNVSMLVIHFDNHESMPTHLTQNFAYGIQTVKSIDIQDTTVLTRNQLYVAPPELIQYIVSNAVQTIGRLHKKPGVKIPERGNKKCRVLIHCGDNSIVNFDMEYYQEHSTDLFLVKDAKVPPRWKELYGACPEHMNLFNSILQRESITSAMIYSSREDILPGALRSCIERPGLVLYGMVFDSDTSIGRDPEERHSSELFCKFHRLTDLLINALFDDKVKKTPSKILSYVTLLESIVGIVTQYRAFDLDRPRFFDDIISVFTQFIEDKGNADSLLDVNWLNLKFEFGEKGLQALLGKVFSKICRVDSLDQMPSSSEDLAKYIGTLADKISLIFFEADMHHIFTKSLGNRKTSEDPFHEQRKRYENLLRSWMIIHDRVDLLEQGSRMLVNHYLFFAVPSLLFSVWSKIALDSNNEEYHYGYWDNVSVSSKYQDMTKFIESVEASIPSNDLMEEFRVRAKKYTHKEVDYVRSLTVEEGGLTPKTYLIQWGSKMKEQFDSLEHVLAASLKKMEEENTRWDLGEIITTWKRDICVWLREKYISFYGQLDDDYADYLDIDYRSMASDLMESRKEFLFRYLDSIQNSRVLWNVPGLEEMTKRTCWTFVYYALQRYPSFWSSGYLLYPRKGEERIVCEWGFGADGSPGTLGPQRKRQLNDLMADVKKLIADLSEKEAASDLAEVLTERNPPIRRRLELSVMSPKLTELIEELGKDFSALDYVEHLNDIYTYALHFLPQENLGGKTEIAGSIPQAIELRPPAIDELDPSGLFSLNTHSSDFIALSGNIISPAELVSLITGEIFQTFRFVHGHKVVEDLIKTKEYQGRHIPVHYIKVVIKVIKILNSDVAFSEISVDLTSSLFQCISEAMVYIRSQNKYTIHPLIPLCFLANIYAENGTAAYDFIELMGLPSEIKSPTDREIWASDQFSLMNALLHRGLEMNSEDLNKLCHSASEQSRNIPAFLDAVIRFYNLIQFTVSKINEKNPSDQLVTCRFSFDPFQPVRGFLLVRLMDMNDTMDSSLGESSHGHEGYLASSDLSIRRYSLSEYMNSGYTSHNAPKFFFVTVDPVDGKSYLCLGWEYEPSRHPEIIELCAATWWIKNFSYVRQLAKLNRSYWLCWTKRLFENKGSMFNIVMQDVRGYSTFSRHLRRWSCMSLKCFNTTGLGSVVHPPRLTSEFGESFLASAKMGHMFCRLFSNWNYKFTPIARPYADEKFSQPSEEIKYLDANETLAAHSIAVGKDIVASYELTDYKSAGHVTGIRMFFIPSVMNYSGIDFETLGHSQEPEQEMPVPEDLLKVPDRIVKYWRRVRFVSSVELFESLLISHESDNSGQELVHMITPSKRSGLSDKIENFETLESWQPSGPIKLPPVFEDISFAVIEYNYSVYERDEINDVMRLETDKAGRILLEKNLATIPVGVYCTSMDRLCDSKIAQCIRILYYVTFSLGGYSRIDWTFFKELPQRSMSIMDFVIPWSDCILRSFATALSTNYEFNLTGQGPETMTEEDIEEAQELIADARDSETRKQPVSPGTLTNSPYVYGDASILESHGRRISVIVDSVLRPMRYRLTPGDVQILVAPDKSSVNQTIDPLGKMMKLFYYLYAPSQVPIPPLEYRKIIEPTKFLSLIQGWETRVESRLLAFDTTGFSFVHDLSFLAFLFNNHKSLSTTMILGEGSRLITFTKTRKSIEEYFGFYDAFLSGIDPSGSFKTYINIKMSGLSEEELAEQEKTWKQILSELKGKKRVKILSDEELDELSYNNFLLIEDYLSDEKRDRRRRENEGSDSIAYEALHKGLLADKKYSRKRMAKVIDMIMDGGFLMPRDFVNDNIDTGELDASASHGFFQEADDWEPEYEELKAKRDRAAGPEKNALNEELSKIERDIDIGKTVAGSIDPGIDNPRLDEKLYVSLYLKLEELAPKKDKTADVGVIKKGGKILVEIEMREVLNRILTKKYSLKLTFTAKFKSPNNKENIKFINEGYTVSIAPGLKKNTTVTWQDSLIQSLLIAMHYAQIKSFNQVDNVMKMMNRDEIKIVYAKRPYIRDSSSGVNLDIPVVSLIPWDSLSKIATDTGNPIDTRIETTVRILAELFVCNIHIYTIQASSLKKNALKVLGELKADSAIGADSNTYSFVQVRFKKAKKLGLPQLLYFEPLLKA